MRDKFILLITILTLLIVSKSFGTEPTDSTNLTRDGIAKIVREHFDGRWFLSYHYKKEDGEEINQFAVKRSYLSLKHKFNESFDVRFTQDITIDEEGEDAGNVEMRLKYAYLNMNLDNFAFFYEPCVEIGLAHRPWNDFEQSINNYRVQGPMFLNRSRLFSSADFGFTFNALLGGKVDETYQKVVSDSYPGKYGSFSIGVYNGGGYHEFERNQNKTLESRLSLRPFPENIPGLQFTYFNIFGKGNIPSSPDFNLHNLFLSYEHRNFVFTSQLYKGKGNASGTFINDFGKAYKNEGYSVFGEYKFPEYKWSLFLRYDDFKVNQSELLDRECLIWGVGYELFGKSKLIFDMEYYDESLERGGANYFYELAMDIRF